MSLPEVPPANDIGSMAGGQLRDALARRLRESEKFAVVEAFAALSRPREELFGAKSRGLAVAFGA